jgi:hypothetical protein
MTTTPKGQVTRSDGRNLTSGKPGQRQAADTKMRQPVIATVARRHRGLRRVLRN